MQKEILLKVGTLTDPAKFAGALVNNHLEGKVVTARALGASANYTMSKGLHIASQFFAVHGLELFVKLSTAKETFDEERDIRSFTVEVHTVPLGAELSSLR